MPLTRDQKLAILKSRSAAPTPAPVATQATPALSRDQKLAILKQNAPAQQVAAPQPQMSRDQKLAILKSRLPATPTPSSQASQPKPDENRDYGLFGNIGHAIDHVGVIGDVKKFVTGDAEGTSQGTFKGHADNRTGLEKFVGGVPVVGGAVGFSGDVGSGGSALIGNLAANYTPLRNIKEKNRNVGANVDNRNPLQSAIDAFQYSNSGGDQGKQYNFGTEDLGFGDKNIFGNVGATELGKTFGGGLNVAGSIAFDPTNIGSGGGIIKGLTKGASIARKVENVDQAFNAAGKLAGVVKDSKVANDFVKPVLNAGKDKIGNAFVPGYGLAPEAKQALLNESRNTYIAKDFGNIVGNIVDSGELSLKDTAKLMGYGKKLGLEKEVQDLIVSTKNGANIPLLPEQKAQFSKVLQGEIPGNADHITERAAAVRPIIDKFQSKLVENGILKPERQIDNYVARSYSRYEDPENWAKTTVSQAQKDLSEGKISQDTYNQVNQVTGSILSKTPQSGVKISNDVGISATKEGSGIKFSRKDLSPETRQYLGELDGGYTVANTLAKQGVLNAKSDLLKQFKSYASDTYQPGYHPDPLPLSMKYGELAGKHVPEPMYKALTLADNPGELQGLMKAIGGVTNLWKTFKVGVFNPAFFVKNGGSGMIMNYLNGMSAADVAAYTARAAKDTFQKGDLWKEATGEGLFATGFYNNKEFKNLLPKTSKSGIEGVKDKVAKITDPFLNGKFSNARPNDFVEETNRLAAYTYAREQLKATPADAVSFAEKAQYNYSDITKTERGIKNTAIPFYTFTRKSAEQLARTIWNDPGKLNNIYKLTDKQGDPNDNQYLPDYAKQRTGIIKTGDGGFLDVSGFIPYSNAIDLPNLANQATSAGPIFGTYQNLANNYDPFRKKQIIPNSELGTKYQLPDQLAYAFQQYQPPVLNSTFNKVLPALRGEQETAGAGRVRSADQAFLDVLTGLKYSPVNKQAAIRSQQYTKSQKLSEVTSKIKSINKDKNLSDDGRKKELAKQEDLRRQIINSN